MPDQVEFELDEQGRKPELPLVEKAGVLVITSITNQSLEAFVQNERERRLNSLWTTDRAAAA